KVEDLSKQSQNRKVRVFLFLSVTIGLQFQQVQITLMEANDAVGDFPFIPKIYLTDKICVTGFNPLPNGFGVGIRFGTR
ncbi:hypothetical protein LINGRAHAP2_LOCUS6295, partial [Linum grandiflorum]